MVSMRTASNVGDLATPAALVNADVLSANVAAMALRARAVGAALRPHFKTHKSVEIARLQRAAGAVGFTVATLREAEALAAAGIDDLLLAYPPVGSWRLERLEALLERARVTFLVDGKVAAAAVGELARRLGATLPCLWEVDCGAGRCGTEPGPPSVVAAQRALDLPGVELDGFLTFPGHVYRSRTSAEVDAAVTDEQEAAHATLAAARAAGLTVQTLSGGTTPTAWRARSGGVLTELRPGNYVFHDATQVALGVAEPAQCALTILATVVSRPAPGRIVVNAGSKALGSELMTPNTRGYAVLAGVPDVHVAALYEEHGLIEAGDALAHVAVGDRVELVPNHACVAANLHRAFVLRRGEEIVNVVELDGRGWERGPALVTTKEQAA